LQVQVVLRQFLRTLRLHARSVLPVSPAHAEAISSLQILGLQGRVAVATETTTPTPRTAAAKVPTALRPIIWRPPSVLVRETRLMVG